MSTVLVVDDKEMLRDSVGATLTRAGFGVVTAADAAGALEMIARRRPDAVVTDLKMPGPGGGGLDLLESAKQIDDALPFVVMTAFGTVDTAVRAIKLGAFDYITKPFEGDELIIAVKRAIEHTRVLRENAVLRNSGEAAGAGRSRGGVGTDPCLRGIDRIIGDSSAIRRVKQQVLAVAESHGTVLICGESGTGKEVVARAVHELSPRTDEAFLAFNCAALSENLLESELFGHEKGAFTGAETLRKGRFELSDNGTLLLDEISEISSRIQAKLLRVLQERCFERVGSSLAIGIDVRVVATSNRDLPKAVGRGDFRQDLFFRLNVLPIHLPPLRDRLDDIPALVAHFAAANARREGKPARPFTDDCLLALQNYSWPGNVRELQNVCERAAVLCRGEMVERSLVEPWLCSGEAALGGVPMPQYAPPPQPAPVTSNGHHPPHHNNGSVLEPKTPPAPGDPNLIAIDGLPLEAIEREVIVRILTLTGGHRQRTADILDIGVRTLGLKIRKWKELGLIDAAL